VITIQSRPLPRCRPSGLAQATRSGPAAAHTNDMMPRSSGNAPGSRGDETRWTAKYAEPITPTMVMIVPSIRTTRIAIFWYAFIERNRTCELVRPA